MNKELMDAVNEYAKWDKFQKEAKANADEYKLVIQNKAVAELENRKTKQIKYWGSDQNCATATNTEKVTMISYEFLKDVIPEKILKEFVKPEEPQYKMTDPFKKMVGPLLAGNYTEQTIADVIKQMHLPADLEKLAKKKLKGTNFEKDVEFIKQFGYDQEEAEYWAYFVNEAATWERIVKLLAVSGYKEGTNEFEKAIENLQAALIVEETLKIGIEYQKE